MKSYSFSSPPYDKGRIMVAAALMYRKIFFNDFTEKFKSRVYGGDS